MARKSVFRRNAIKLGLLALGVIILFGLAATITDTFVVGFEAIPFTIFTTLTEGQLRTLELGSNFAIECRVWLQGEIIDVLGTRSDIGFKTQTFSPQFLPQPLTVIDPRTEQEISNIDTQIRLRCDPVNTGNVVFDGTRNSYTLTGGSVQYYWVADDQDGTTRILTNTITVPIQPSDNVLQGAGGGGLTLASPKITGRQIDSKLTSNQEVYFTSGAVVISAQPEFLFRFDCSQTTCSVNQDEFGDVNFNAEFGPIKVFNQVVDPPKPTSEVVRIVKLETTPSPAYSDSDFVDLELFVQLPQWSAAEGVPRFTLLKPGPMDYIVVATDVPITANRLVDSATDTYEFFISRLDVPQESDGSITTGNWAVEATHPGRTGEDTKGFVILARANQQDPDAKVTEGKDEQSTTNRQELEDNGDPEGMADFLSIGTFTKCIQEAFETGQSSCLNNSAFFPIFGIIAIVVLLSVVSSRRS